MKKKYVITFLVIFLILIIISVNFYVIYNNYKKNYEILKDNVLCLQYMYPFDLLYDKNNYEFPKNLNNYFSDENIKVFINHNFKDLFSKSELLIYYPLYNDSIGKFDTYIIVSRGIDRKLNNKFNYYDTISKYEIFKKFQFYNEQCWKNYNNYFLCDSLINSRFNLFNYLFGKKDYLVFIRDVSIDTLFKPPVQK